MVQNFVTEHITTVDGTFAESITGLAISIILVAIVWAVIKYAQKRAYANDFYNDTVIAYQVGIINKYAEEEGVELVYPTKGDKKENNIATRLRKEVDKDIGKE